MLHGLPIRPEFSARGGSKKSIRTKLGLLHNKPTVLLIGVGNVGEWGRVEGVETPGGVLCQEYANCTLWQ